MNEDRHVTNRQSFLNWLGKAYKGDTCTYWVGFLTVDRQGANRILHELGGEAWRAYKSGAVCLTQRKLDRGIFKYMAVKR